MVCGNFILPEFCKLCLFSFLRNLFYLIYTVKVHFSKDSDKTFKDRVQKLIINECLEKNHK
ncbi:hypothetical protein [Acutalibacter sp. JLR.KK004]|uniref:hypothetical protein n=1 Tax=Acutalibacter sp. JLR.KK004 TaxID=3112622 RepID=UPI003312FA66